MGSFLGRGQSKARDRQRIKETKARLLLIQKVWSAHSSQLLLPRASREHGSLTQSRRQRAKKSYRKQRFSRILRFQALPCLPDSLPALTHSLSETQPCSFSA